MVQGTGSSSSRNGRGRNNFVPERERIARSDLRLVMAMTAQVEPACTVSAPVVSHPALNGVYVDGLERHRRLVVMWDLVSET